MVLYRHGRGGMGNVYAAYDPELDRKVAIKLLRAKGKRRKDARARMLREAQALAKLSHPHVVAIHDVGIHEGRVFVAMDFIEGLTLRRWATQEPRGWRAILEVFHQAGRGLAAAHAAGLVHRDFKPDNVIVGPDHRAQVLDFGLAHSRASAGSELREPAESGNRDLPPPSSGVSLDAPLTREGAILGTPGYMAPEQHRGESTDARSDQFAFCIALYEALYGESPFAGDDAKELRENVVEGNVRDPPRSSVPGWVRRVILRGLKVRPAERFASMDKLLEELSESSRARWRRLVVGGAAAVALTIAAFVAGRTLVDEDSKCRGGADALAGIWDEAKKQDIEAAFLATDKPYADAVWRSTESVIDDYTSAWLAMRTDACEATWVRGDQSEDALYLRMGCLQRRLDELAALGRLFEAADDDVIERAVQAVHGLPAIDGCADVAALSARVPTPDDPSRRVVVSELRTRLAEARAKEASGKYAAGVDAARAVATDAKRIGFRPVEAEAQLALGGLLLQAGKLDEGEAALRSAVIAAEAGDHPEVEARAWIKLLDVASLRPERREVAGFWDQHAAALIERLGGAEALEAELLAGRGNLQAESGRFDDAVKSHREALLVRERLFEDDHPAIAESLRGLGNALGGVGDFAEALESHQRALAVFERLLGPGHPEVGHTLTGIAVTYDELDQVDKSRPLYERVVKIYETAHGPTHPDVATAINNLAAVLYGDGAYEDALAKFRRSLTIWERAYGTEHPDVALTLGNIGLALEGLQRNDEALEHHARALQLRERTLGPDHPDVAVSLRNRADLLDYLERFEEAKPLHERAVRVLERALGPKHPRVAIALWGRAANEEARDEAARAKATFERALEIQRATLGTDHTAYARTLARVAMLDADPRPRPREPRDRARRVRASRGHAIGRGVRDPRRARQRAVARRSATTPGPSPRRIRPRRLPDRQPLPQTTRRDPKLAADPHPLTPRATRSTRRSCRRSPYHRGKGACRPRTR